MIRVLVERPNGALFGHIEISCIEPRGLQADSINGFQAVIHDEDNCQSHRRCTHAATFEHRYGDPWHVLLAKALQAIASTHPVET